MNVEEKEELLRNYAKLKTLATTLLDECTQNGRKDVDEETDLLLDIFSYIVEEEKKLNENEKRNNDTGAST